MHTILCVAPQEDQAEALSYAVITVPDVIVIGLCAPHQVDELVRVTSATLIVTLEGTEIPDAETLGIPVLPVPEVDKAAEVLTAYLKAQAAKQPAAQQTTPIATPQRPLHGYPSLHSTANYASASTARAAGSAQRPPWSPPPSC